MCLPDDFVYPFGRLMYLCCDFFVMEAMYTFKRYAYMHVYEYQLLIFDICSDVECPRDVPQQVLSGHWRAYRQVVVNCSIMQVCVDICMDVHL